MALSQRLEFRQTQGLVMTPQLMQAIKLLQLSNLDLAAYVDAELERNPLLERAGDAEGEGPAEAAPAPEPEVPAASADWLGSELETSREAIEGRLDTSLDNVFPDDAGTTTPARAADTPAYSEWAGVRAGREDGDYNLEAFVEAETTLADHLAEQLSLAIADPRQRLIGQYLI